ncbi:hypothetical protein D9756_010804 [Leucocoprinus leucothites]|uniref:Uncharacterized protein n=1 Tax=Leucocoprinus leucothites TaxID=201217 RepID=A0A8H5FRF8_9AGAR|nr:hypothetical protein D9756_010804 [Leucoagaricus leucothites]
MYCRLESSGSPRVYQHFKHLQRNHFYPTMKFSNIAAVLPFVIASSTQVAAICPGFNFGIGNLQDLGNGIHRWNVYDDSCNQVDGLTTTNNPCTEGIFGCSPPPIIFNHYRNTFSGLQYACRTDPNSGRCGNDVISVCFLAQFVVNIWQGILC